LEFSDLTQRIIGCAYNIFNTLGAGFLESVYHQSLLIELRGAGLIVDSQVPLDVYYHDQPVGSFIADMVVEGTVIIELKAIEQLAKVHEVQLLNYLAATGKPVGLLINFGPSEVQIKRKVRDLKPHPVNPADPVILSKK
jgi:GxxExxY protein